MGFTINEAVGDVGSVEEERILERERQLWDLVSVLPSLNLPDTLSECIPNWHNAYWQRVTKMRDVPCVCWRNLVTVPRREIMCLSDFPNMVTATKIWSASREKIGKHDFYEFMVRFEFFSERCRCPPASTADSTCLWICGWEKHLDTAYVRSSRSQPSHPASNLHSLNMCSDSSREGNDLSHSGQPGY